MTNRYQKLIEVLRWLIKLERIDILTEVSFYLNTCVTQERYTLMLFIVSSGIYRRTWVRTQGGWHTNPLMNQHMKIYFRFLEEIYMGGKISTLILRK